MASIEEEMTRDKHTHIPEPKPQPLFSHENPITQQRFFAGPGPVFTHRLAPRVPELTDGILRNDKLSEEIRAYHEEAEMANNLALKKQIETLKMIVAEQSRNTYNV